MRLNIRHHAYSWKNFITGHQLFSVRHITSKIISYPSTPIFLLHSSPTGSVLSFNHLSRTAHLWVSVYICVNKSVCHFSCYSYCRAISEGCTTKNLLRKSLSAITLFNNCFYLSAQHWESLGKRQIHCSFISRQQVAAITKQQRGSFPRMLQKSFEQEGKMEIFLLQLNLIKNGCKQSHCFIYLLQDALQHPQKQSLKLFKHYQNSQYLK